MLAQRVTFELIDYEAGYADTNRFTSVETVEPLHGVNDGV